MKNTQKGFVPVLIIASVAIIAIGGIWYGVSNNTSENETASSTLETTVEATTTASTGNPTSIDAALASGGSYMCTFEIKDPNTESSGTYYISNKRIRGDFTSTNKMVSQSIQSHTVIDEKFSYTWTDLAPTMGYKVPVIAPTPNASTPAQGQLNLNGAAAQYNCTPWKSDSSKFVIPASVKFMEVPSAQ